MTDLVVIGAGTAGLTAAVYARRAGLTVEVIERGVYGGQIITTTSIENYPGMPGVSGGEFAVALYEQAKGLGAGIRYENIAEVSLAGDPKRIVTDRGETLARAVILATGAEPRKLECPGGDAFIGRGISFCATCDGAFFRGRYVAVVGGGNVAIDDALVLSGLCRTVHLVHRRAEFRGEKLLLTQLQKKDNVVFHTETTVAEVLGEDRVAGLVIERDGARETLDVDGVFVAIGSVPNNGLFAGQIPLDAYGYIVAGEDCRTGVPGVFAAGDARTKEVRQIVTAAADGAVAALAVGSYLEGLAE